MSAEIFAIICTHISQQSIIVFVFVFLQCDPGTGVDAFFHALYSQKNSTKIIALLGTACDEVTERVSKVATHQRIVQVSTLMTDIWYKYKVKMHM